jgi:hypothetical protein
MVTRSIVRYRTSKPDLDVVAELMLTPFAGINRSRFKGLRRIRTLSALCSGAPLSCAPTVALSEGRENLGWCAPVGS